MTGKVKDFELPGPNDLAEFDISRLNDLPDFDMSTLLKQTSFDPMELPDITQLLDNSEGKTRIARCNMENDK